MKPGRGIAFLLILLLFIPVMIKRAEVTVWPAPVFVDSVVSGRCYIELRGTHFFEQDRHIIDACGPRDVIVLADTVVAQQAMADFLANNPLVDGQTIEIVDVGNGSLRVETHWMNAARRIALGIALHPQRMTEQDWQALPGVGAKLATKIMADRQQNGGFATFYDLKRVSGISEKTVERWKGYF